MDLTNCAQGTPVSLDYLESKDAGLFNLLRTEIEDLKNLAKKTQVKGLKEGIDKVSDLIASIENNKTEIKVMRSQQEGSRTLVVDAKKVVTIIKQDISGAVAAANKVILEAITSSRCAGDHTANAGHTPDPEGAQVRAAIADVQTMLATQDEKISKLATIAQGTGWTDVVKRNNGRKPPENISSKENATAGPIAAKRQTLKSVEGVYPPRKKPPAIIVRLKDGGYSEALKKLKGSDQVKAASENIVGLTKTRNGDLLIRVKAASETSTQLMDAVGTAMGDRSAVMELVQYQKIVVQDLDEIAEDEEIVGAISSLANTSPKETRVVSTMLQARGQKWAIVSLPATLAEKVLSAGKLRVGYVSCRVRRWEVRRYGRCPRCLSTGHARADCKGPNRENCCRACGANGHFEANCGASEEDKAGFKAQIAQQIDRTDTTVKSPRTGNQATDPSHQ